MHWVQDGRIRSHCSAQGVERVLLRTMNKQKGVGGTYPQSSLPARPTSVGRAAMEGHGDQQLRLFIRNVVSPRMRGAGVSKRIDIRLGDWMMELGELKGCGRSGGSQGLASVTREERDKDRKRNWLPCML